MDEKTDKELLKEIYHALVGNEALGVDGIVSKITKNANNIKENSIKIERVENNQKRAKWISLGIGAGAGAGASKGIGVLLKMLGIF